MSNCKLDHSLEDVQKKYESQVDFLPGEIKMLFQDFFATQPSQQVLNEVFHLLKKYDLASDHEKSQRNIGLLAILKSL